MSAKYPGDDDIKRELEKLRADADQKIDTVLKNQDSILSKAAKGALKKEFAKVKLLLKALKDYISGEYKELPYGTITAIAAVLFYVFLPTDLIPDIIPALGLTDDAAMILFVWKYIQEDIRKYALWKIEKGDKEVEQLFIEAFGDD